MDRTRTLLSKERLRGEKELSGMGEDPITSQGCPREKRGWERMEGQLCRAQGWRSQAMATPLQVQQGSPG